MTIKRDFAFSRRDAPEVLKNLPPREGVGNAGCPVHPQPRVRMGSKYAHEYSQRSHRKSPGIPARNGFNGFLRALPGDRAFLSPSIGSALAANLTPASRRQDHTASPSATVYAKGFAGLGTRPPKFWRRRSLALSSEAPLASTASRPASVTMASAPRVGRDGGGYRGDLGLLKIRIFFQKGLDRPLTKPPGDLPVGLRVRAMMAIPSVAGVLL